MTSNRRLTRTILLGATALTGALALTTTQASAQDRRYDFDVPAQPLNAALQTFARQSRLQVIFADAQTKGLQAPPLSGTYSADEALQVLLAGTDLKVIRNSKGVLQVAASADPQSGSAAGDGAEVEALIVTAQKREEDIQDVPIAISAFTQEDLTRSQVAGGPDLVTQVPNFTFTKTNFSSYSIQIRGIGTQAISATTDPAVAVAFNNTPFIRNRFFEQEFYDLQRVEVLRGPQGTLYGRNATAGVVNIISQKPTFRFEAKASADISNYSSTRIEGMVNLPLVEDKAALRLAGAWTKRDGYATNQITGNPIDGRDLWSSRVSLRVTPSDRLDANLIWEHFEEDDDRLRSGKQLCDKDVVTSVAGFPTPNYFQTLPETGQSLLLSGVQASFSQGCKRESLYSPDSFQTPNGLMLPYYLPLGAIGLKTKLNDPYLSTVQSSDLRVIESTIDPDYRAKSDLGELQVSYDVSGNLTLTSETAYSTDMVYSLQDFNRFNTAPGAWENPGDNPTGVYRPGGLRTGPNGGIFCDPQLGCSDRLVAVDVSTAQSWQFSEELRLASDFTGPLNFSLGANYLRADSEDKYYVFINSISQIAVQDGSTAPYVNGVTDNHDCLTNGYAPGDPNGVYSVTDCVYIDPNPIGSVNDQGHNYFLSKNPYKLISYAVFGEAYYQLADNLKITGGLRWTVDKKEAPRIPTWILASQSYGYPVAEVIEQEWREPTGRLTVDWKPDLAFTDETLIYGSIAHGYKAGGANPPGFVRSYYADASVANANTQQSATRPTTFEPEFVNAYEIGSKNTLLDGRATMNVAAFYYDYTGYQVSEIVDRSAFNRNFDAEVWGAEFEADWRPIENLRLGFKAGYEKTRIGDNEAAIDLMDRTAGDPRWVLHRPFPTFASSCILPAWLFVGNVGSTSANPELVNLGGVGGGNPGGCELAYVIGVDPVTRAAYQADPSPFGLPITHADTINYANWSTDPNDYPGLTWAGGIVTNRAYPGWDPSTAPNNGEGIAKPLGGNELPNAPHFTATVTGDYTLPLPNEWLMALHTDVHWQSQSWWRVFNDSTYDKLHPYFTMNLAAIFTNEDQGWNIMAYVKNVTDETAITGAFLNSDDTGLTTNVFLTEPRLYGIRITKQWTDGSLLGSFGARHEGPYPFTVELGGQIQRHDAANTPFEPSFTNEFATPLNLIDSSQESDLDWGDGREVKLTYQPSSSGWNVSAGIRYGKTNASNTPNAQQQTTPACGFGGPFASFCTTFADHPKYGPLTRVTKTNWSDASVIDREEYEILDLAVGRDVGLGGFGDSRISLGLRRARLESTTHAQFRGVPDWTIPNGFLLPFPGQFVTHTEYSATLDAVREFEGLGPTLLWEGSHSLFSNADTGNFNIDWSLGGGVLFGDQDASVSAAEVANAYSMFGFVAIGLAEAPLVPIPQPSPPPINEERSKSATVPNASVSLGLSYDIDRLRIGAGYRWERYFHALDGGVSEHEDADRTIDGPYFKISVGFGGG